MRPNVDSILQSYDSLLFERQSFWDELIQACMEFAMPQNATHFRIHIKGFRRRFRVWDDTAVKSSQRLAQYMYSQMTPSDKIWYKFQAKDPKLREIEAVTNAYNEVTRISYSELARSNYSLEQHETYLSHVTAGIAAKFEDKQPGKPVVFKHIPYGKYVHSLGADGFANTFMYVFPMTAAAMQEAWPDPGMLSGEVLAAANDPGKKFDEFDILHAVFPRHHQNEGESKNSNKNLPFASFKIDMKNRHQIMESGFHEFPFTVSRFLSQPGDKQGISPTMLNLRDIKTLNLLNLALVQGAQEISIPSIVYPAEGVHGHTSRSPGENVYIKNNIFKDMKPYPLNTGTNLPVNEAIIKHFEEKVKSGYFEELTALFINDQAREKTFGEAQLMDEEKADLFLPTLGRLQVEEFQPMLTRHLALLQRDGLFDHIDFPEEMIDENGNVDFEVEYLGKLAIKLRSMELRNFMDAATVLAPFMEERPEMKDWIKFDKLPAVVFDRFNVIEDLQNDQVEVDAIREERAEAQAAEKQRLDMLEAADAAKGLEQTVQADSVLDKLTTNTQFG